MNILGKILTLTAVGAVAVHYAARALATPRSPEQADRRLRDQIRQHLAERLLQADAIEVVVNEGDVSLRGELFADEVEGVLSGVLAMPGVRHIHNRLTPVEPGLPRSTMQDAMQVTVP